LGLPGEELMAKKRGIATLTRYFREVKLELRKVSWPQRREILVSTAVVIVTVLMIALYIGGIDYLFTIIIRIVTLRF